MKRLTIFLVAATLGYVHQQSIVRSSAAELTAEEQVVRISASTFEFTPNEITLKKGVPVVLQLTSKDRHHGFKLVEFHIRADVKPGATEEVRFVPDKVGKFHFFCDVFCGDGHEEMSGTFTVIES